MSIASWILSADRGEGVRIETLFAIGVSALHTTEAEIIWLHREQRQTVVLAK